MATETELKLTIASADLDKFKQHDFIVPFGIGKEHHLISHYFDTPEANLRKLGYSLRIRENGDRFIQTLKYAGSSVAGLHQRHEWEHELPGLTLDYDLIDDVRLRKHLSGRLGKQLAPVFKTDFMRTTWDVTFGESRIECALDRGKVVCEKQTTLISEVELELVHGHAGDLYALGLHLLEDIPLQIENRSKAGRGFYLSNPKKLRSIPMKPIKLESGLEVDVAFVQVIRHLFSVWQANQTVFLWEDNGIAYDEMQHAIMYLSLTFDLMSRTCPGWVDDLLLDDLQWLLKDLKRSRFRERFSDSRYHRLLLRLGYWLAHID